MFLPPVSNRWYDFTMTKRVLDKQLKEAADQGVPVEVVDPATQQVYYLISAEQFQKYQAALAEDFNPREVYPVIDRVMAQDDALDPLLDSYQ